MKKNRNPKPVVNRKCVICRKQFTTVVTPTIRTFCHDEICKSFYYTKRLALRTNARRSRDRKLNRQVTVEQWINILIRFDHTCAYCPSKLDLTLDHVVPLSRSGQHTEANIVPACRRCNEDKSDMLLIEWRFLQMHPIYRSMIRDRQYRKLLRPIRDAAPENSSPFFVIV